MLTCYVKVEDCRVGLPFLRVLEGIEVSHTTFLLVLHERNGSTAPSLESLVLPDFYSPAAITGLHAIQQVAHLAVDNSVGVLTRVGQKDAQQALLEFRLRLLVLHFFHSHITLVDPLKVGKN